VQKKIPKFQAICFRVTGYKSVQYEGENTQDLIRSKCRTDGIIQTQRTCYFTDPCSTVSKGVKWTIQLHFILYSVGASYTLLLIGP
jgi:hypothetical protein